MSSAYGGASGSQTASGANSSVVGSQAVQVGDDAVAAGLDATITDIENQPVKEGRPRKRGKVIAFATFIGATAAVVGTVAGVCVWIG